MSTTTEEKPNDTDQLPAGEGLAATPCSCPDVGIEFGGEDGERVTGIVNEYLAQFNKPIKRGEGNFMSGADRCLKCDSALAGMMGTFRWGIRHGEGECSECGWPARAYHRFMVDGEELLTAPFQYVLQYHPDFVSMND